MTNDNSLKLGKGKDAYSLNMQNLKAGVRKEALKEFANLFEMYDVDGNEILTNEEIGKVKSDVELAAKGGRDSVFSEKDAMKMLEQNQAQATKADAQKLFNFLKAIENKAAEILNYEEGETKIVTKRKDEKGNEINETFDKTTGKTERVISANGQTITTILKGEVKEKETIVDDETGETTEITYDEAGQKPVKKVITTKGEKPSTTTIDYKNGIKSKKVIEDADSKTTIDYENGIEKKKVLENADSKTTIYYENGKESKKTVETKNGTEVYTYENGKEKIQSKVENKNTIDQRTIEYTYQADGSTETITDRTGTEVIQHKNNGTVISSKNGRTTTVEKSGNGYKETIETEGSETKTVNQLNADKNRVKSTKTVNGKEYTLNYDGEGNITGVIVQFGENPAKIAKRFGCSVEDLINANKDIIKTDKKGRKYFEVGAEIKVPDKDNKLEADAKVFQGRKDAAGAKADYRKWQQKQEEIRKQRAAEDAELAERKQNKFTFIEKKYNTFEEMAKAHFLQEGVKNPTARQIALRVEEYKSYNPNLKDGELIGKKVTASFNKNTASGISERQKAREAARENIKTQTKNAQNIYNQLMDAKGFFNDDEDAMKLALKSVDTPEELNKLNELLEKKGYKADNEHSAIEKFLEEELDSEYLETTVMKWISNGTLKGDAAVKAQARLAVRKITDGGDGFGTDCDKVKEGIRLIKAPKLTGNATTDKKNAKAVYDEVNRIISKHKTFYGIGSASKNLQDYLEGEMWDSEIKYLDGILAENNAIQGAKKVQAITDLAVQATDGWGTNIEELEQALRACSTPEERKAVEAQLEKYCKDHKIQGQIKGQSAIQKLLYSECDGFAGIGTDHKEIREFNEMMIKNGAYTDAEAVQIRAEQAALQILEGSHSDVMEAVSQIKDKAVLEALDKKLQDKGKGSLREFLATQFKGNQTKQDLVLANLASKNLLSTSEAAQVAARLVQNSDFDTRAAGLQAIRTSDVANEVNKLLKNSGTSLERIYTQFNAEKSEYKLKGDFWDSIAQTTGLGLVAEYISDQYYENTDMADELYLEASTAQTIDPQKKAGYQATVQALEDALNAAQEKYNQTIKSQGWVSAAIDNFCSVYNLGTTRDEIEATLKFNEETVRLLKIAAEGKLTKMVNGKTENVSFEEIFAERQSKTITANGGGIVNNAKNAIDTVAGVLGIDNTTTVQYDAEKTEKVANKAQTLAAMDIAKDGISACWNELDRAKKEGNQKAMTLAICNTLEKISQMSNKQLTLDGFGYTLQHGYLIDSKGFPVSMEKLTELSNTLKQGLSQITQELFGVSIPEGADASKVDQIVEDAFAEKEEKFKQEYREAFGQDCPDEIIDNYVSTIQTGMTVLNIGVAIGAFIAAPFTGGGSLGVFLATVGGEMALNGLEHSTDAYGYTDNELTGDLTQATFDASLAVIGFKVGQYTETISKGSKIFLSSGKLSPQANELVNTIIRKAAATGIDVTSDVFTSAVAEYLQRGEVTEEGFWNNMMFSVVGNTFGHIAEGKGGVGAAAGDIGATTGLKHSDDIHKPTSSGDTTPTPTKAEAEVDASSAKPSEATPVDIKNKAKVASIINSLSAEKKKIFESLDKQITNFKSYANYETLKNAIKTGLAGAEDAISVLLQRLDAVYEKIKMNISSPVHISNVFKNLSSELKPVYTQLENKIKNFSVVAEYVTLKNLIKTQMANASDAMDVLLKKLDDKLTELKAKFGKAGADDGSYHIDTDEVEVIGVEPPHHVDADIEIIGVEPPRHVEVETPEVKAKIEAKIDEIRQKAHKIETQTFTVNGKKVEFEVFYGSKDGGSNTGYYVVNKETGELFYAKEPNGGTQWKAEVAAAKLYQAAGIDAPQVDFFTLPNGKPGVLSKFIPDLQPLQQPHALANSGFGMDVLLENWDSVGMQFDNTLITADGSRVIKLDAGGSFDFKAQGGPKDFTNIPVELVNMLNPHISPQASQIFGKMTQADLMSSLEKAIKLSDSDIDKILKDCGCPQYAETLKKRRAFMQDVLTEMKKNPQLPGESTFTFMQRTMNSTLETAIAKATTKADLDDIAKALDSVQDNNVKANLMKKLDAQKLALTTPKKKGASLKANDIQAQIEILGVTHNYDGSVTLNISQDTSNGLYHKYGSLATEAKKRLSEPLSLADFQNIATMLNRASEVIDISGIDMQNVILTYNSIKHGDSGLFTPLEMAKMTPQKWATVVNTAKHQISAGQLDAMMKYKVDSSEMNCALSEIKKGTDPKKIDSTTMHKINKLQEYINTQTIEESVTVVRVEGYYDSWNSCNNPYGCLSTFQFDGGNIDASIKKLLNINGSSTLDEVMERALSISDPQMRQKAIDAIEDEFNHSLNQYVAQNERFTSTKVTCDMQPDGKSVDWGNCVQGGGKVVWELNLTAGSKGAFLEGNNFKGLYSGEAEILLQRDSYFAITEVKWNDTIKRWVVKADVSQTKPLGA